MRLGGRASEGTMEADSYVGTFDGQEFLRIMQTNVLGALLVTEAFRDNVVASSQKKIIGVSSHAGLTSTGGALAQAYCTTTRTSLKFCSSV
jgi:NAD(P)-dependent dehydrogenase (short-subunit alcohol dehydrogenase family)